MDIIDAFLCYSHKDRFLAGCIKKTLGSYGINAFLAHDDLLPSQEWQEEIARRLHACEVFFLLLTDSFRSSDWTDQETGIAVALNKIIVPIKVTLNPYGFVGRYQAQPLEGAPSGRIVYPLHVDEGCWNIVRTLAQRSDVGFRIKNGMIRTFAQSGAFKEAAHYAARLRDLEPFHPAQVKEIVRVSSSNSQIYESFAARDYVRDLIRRNVSYVPLDLFRHFGQMAGVPDLLGFNSATG